MSSDLGRRSPEDSGMQRRHADLADVLERVLDKGIVVAGDITVSVIDIELLTIKLRLLIASADKAREMGIDWWRHDPYLSEQARALGGGDGHGDGQSKGDVSELKDRLDRLEEILQSIRGPELQQGRPRSSGVSSSGSKRDRGRDRG